jgi:lipid-binding SYLF domain-containing protein
MKPAAVLTGLLLPTFALAWSTTVLGQVAAPTDFPSRETIVVDDSCQVLKEIMEIPAKGIPVALLADAKGIVVVPQMMKGGFVVGIRHGHGVMLVRDEKGGWRCPVFVTVTGGSVGWQIGLQSTDLILVFKTGKSVQQLLHGKFTIGADAAATAGPVGREAAAATDATLAAEILSYSRTRGLFVGISLDGSAIQIDSVANAQYYRAMAAVSGRPPEIPASAQKLLDTVAGYTLTASAPAPRVTPVPQN